MKISTTKLLSAFVLMLSAVNCTKSADNQNIIRMRLPGDPPTLDWALAVDNVSKEVINNIQEGLVGQDTGSSVEPALAASWTVDPTGTVYEFVLRDGIKWSDGQPVVAQHFLDAWERLLNPATASEYAYFLFDVKGAEDYQSGKSKDFSSVAVSSSSPKNIRVELKHAASYWIHIPAFWSAFPIRKDLIAKFGDKWTQAGNLVTTGPYVLKEWQRESRILLEKNPHYHNEAQMKSAPDKVEFRTVKEGSIAVTLFKNKEIDIVRDLPPIQVPTLAALPEFVTHNQFRGYYMGFKLKNPQVSDIKVRQAIAMAINREELGKVLTGLVVPAKSWIPKGMIGYDGSIGIDYNPEKAKEIWASIKNPPKNIEIWFDSGERNKIVGENLQSQVKKVLGLDLVIQIQEWKVYLKSLHTDQLPFFRMGWGADYPDPDNFMNLFTCNSGNNLTQFCDKNFDKWILEAAATADTAKRVELYTKAQKVLLEDQIAFVPLFTETAPHLVSRRVKNFSVNPMGDFAFKRLELIKEESP